MNTSLRASRVGLAGAALLAAVALTACGASSSGAGGAAASSPAASSSGPAASGGPSSTPGSAASGAASTGAAGPTRSASTSTVTVPAGGPVPIGFAARSVTFVSPQEAFVLGTAPCAKAPCTSILRTLNRGASWRGLPAPVVPLATLSESTEPAVWGIRFANPSDGFVFGNGLWETTDGGEHWSSAASPRGSIESLEVIDGQLLAAVGPCPIGGGCSTQGSLQRRPLAGGAWQVVAPVAGSGVIATQARVAAVLDGDDVIVTANGGVSTVTPPGPCSSTAGLNAPAWVAVTGPTGLAVMCAGDGAAGSVGKIVFVSDDLGSHWTRTGAPARGGDPEGVSAASASQLVVAAASGASMLYYSGDGGARWSTAYYEGDGGLGFNDLGFTTAADGVVVYGPAQSDDNAESRPGWLLLTSNGGASWQPVSF